MGLGRKIVLATGNIGKLKEINALLANLPIEVVPQNNFGVPEAEETGLSFIENALIKARNAAAYTGLPAIADDSGLACEALDGAPGIFSARFAGATASDDQNVQKLLQELSSFADESRAARFICVMAFVEHEHDPAPIIREGVWQGRIATSPCGDNGFGYDPIFYVPGENCTSAELPAATKNRLSHRGQAMGALAEWLKLRFANA